MSYVLTPEAIVRAAKALALACNGGDWEKDYTLQQQQLWMQRVNRALLHYEPGKEGGDRETHP